MENYNNIRVYAVDMEYVSEPLTQEEFMSLAEELGLVWTLDGFEDEFNSGFMGTDNLIIKFIQLEY
jgi:hypothetical protein